MVDGPASESKADPWKPIGNGRWVGSAASERFPVYTRGNAGEVYPEVFTPLTYSMVFETTEQAFRNALTHTGLIRRHEVDDVPLSTGLGSGVFGGYVYLNLSTQRLAAARFPGGKASDADTNYLGVGQSPPLPPDGTDRNISASIAGLRYLFGVLRGKSLPDLDRDQRRVDAALAGLATVETADTQQLLDDTRSLTDLSTSLFETHLIVSGGAGLAVTALTQMCERQLGEAELAVQLLAGLGEVDSAAPSTALWVLGRSVAAAPDLTAHFDQGVDGLWDRLRSDPTAAAFVTDFQSFLDRFGSRGPNEWDTAFDTWGTKPELALHLVDRMRGTDPGHDPRVRLADLSAEAAALEQATLARLKGPNRYLFKKALFSARAYSRARERSKTTVVRAIHGARVRSMEIDRRAREKGGGQRGDLWFVVESEIDGYLADPPSFAEAIAERRAMHAELARRIPPFFFEGVQPPLESWELRDAAKPAVAKGEVIQGLPGCRGVSRGLARVVLDPSDPRGLAPGEVLVAPITDPSWTPLFVAAEAVVVDVGAVMSHAVIVSRELGIPCAVSVTDATRRIPDGALIEVDGTSGRVTILELP